MELRAHSRKRSEWTSRRDCGSSQYFLPSNLEVELLEIDKVLLLLWGISRLFCAALLWRNGGEGAAVVAAVDQLDGELEVLLALLGVGVEAHGLLLPKLQSGEGGQPRKALHLAFAMQGNMLWSAPLFMIAAVTIIVSMSLLRPWQD